MKTWTKVVLELNFLGIRCHKSQTFMNLKRSFLIMARNMSFFFINFNTNLKTSGMLLANAKIQNLCTLVHGEVLRQFDLLSLKVGSKTLENLKNIILGLVAYFFPANVLSRKKRSTHCGTKKPCIVKMRCYTHNLIDLNR